MCKNLEIYNAVRKVPQEAQKPITGGRLKGKTDINPMWRIKTLTEQFGVVGFGWYTEMLSQWTEKSDNGEVAAFCNINLYVRQGDEWSKPIFGTGGAMLVEIEKSGAHTEDEAFKKAYTDAISVACKSIGIGADIYWASDRTKYQTSVPSAPTQPSAQPKSKVQQQAAQPKQETTKRSITAAKIEDSATVGQLYLWLDKHRTATINNGGTFDAGTFLSTYYDFDSEGTKQTLLDKYTNHLSSMI